MEEQGKRLLLSVAIAFGLMMIWQKLFPPEPKSDEQTSVSQNADAPQQAASATDTAAGDEAAALVELGPEVLHTFKFDTYSATYSTHGATLKSFQLHGEKFRDRKKNAPEELVRVSQKPLFGIDFDRSTFPIPEKTEWVAEEVSDREMRFTWSNEDLKVVKLFKMKPETYSIELLIDIESLRERARQTLRVHSYSFQDLSEDTGGGMSRMERDWKATCLVDKELESFTSTELSKSVPKSFGGQVSWAGFVHAYFLVAMSPATAEGRRISCQSEALKDVPGGMEMSLTFPEIALEANTPATETILLYLGPKFHDVLENIDKANPNGHLHKAVDLGFLSFIAGPLLAMLKWIYGFVGNWGVAIILLTFVVKAVTLPWVHRSMKSMQAMAKLRPEMDKIKEQYKDDPKRQQLETMNLMKTNNVSFLSGCLPMILQMPIWFAFYRALMVATELYQAKFLWVSDLTLPDPLYIMPIAVTAMMFLQTRLTPQTASGMQQKMLSIGMPLMFGVFSFFFPAGLTLYIFTNTCLTAIHHLFMHKDKRREAAEAKIQLKNKKTVIDVPDSDVKEALTQEKSKSKTKSNNKNKQKKKNN